MFFFPFFKYSYFLPDNNAIYIIFKLVIILNASLGVMLLLFLIWWSYPDKAKREKAKDYNKTACG